MFIIIRYVQNVQSQRCLNFIHILERYANIAMQRSGPFETHNVLTINILLAADYQFKEWACNVWSGYIDCIRY